MTNVSRNNKWIVKNKIAEQIKKGLSLLTADALISKKGNVQEGDIIHIVDEREHFVAKAYYGEQNKGIGWVLTTDKQTKIDESFFKVTLKKAFNRRATFYQSEDTTAFRVFNGEGDGIGGLTIEYFAGYYVINWYSAGIYTYKQDVIQALESLVDFHAIYEKKRFKQKGAYIEDDDFVTGTRGEFPIIIKENNMNYAVDLNDGAMTGIFLDQREVRKAVRDTYVEGKRVLNTFSYTGAFSVAASLGGAVQTTSVDVAKRSLPKTKEQLQVNNIDDEQEKIHVMDVFEYVKYARRKKLVFDLVILDPPSFARTKKYTFSAAKDYAKLVSEVASITEKNGIIIASTNHAAQSMKQFKAQLNKGLNKANISYQIKEEYRLPEDFRINQHDPQSNYLKVVVLELM